MKLLKQVQARLSLADTETAMRPYKPKTPVQLRPKTDPAHRMMREAYKRRTSTDKAKQKRYSDVYRRKNASQIKQRNKRSRMLHAGFADALQGGPISNWCYEYTWDDGLLYSMVIHGTRFEADCTAQRLGLRYGGELIAVYPVGDVVVDRIKNNLPLAKTHESNPSKNQASAAVYAGCASLACKNCLC
jgi:hypothetical protein